MVDFKSIETFLWVVTLGSFRGAGQRLNTTQPAISQRMAQLEPAVGVKLRHRDRLAHAERPAIDGLCGKTDQSAPGDDGRGRRALGNARRLAVGRRRNPRPY